MRVLPALFLMILTPWSAAALAEGSDCVLGSTESPRAGLSAQAPGSGEVPGQVRFTCSGERVDSISARLVPGDSAQARLVLSGVPERFVRIQSRQAEPETWVRVESQRLDEDIVLVILHIALPESVPPDTRHSALIRFAPTVEGDATFEIPLTLEVEQGGSIFGDEFDHGVEPSIGQFSMVL